MKLPTLLITISLTLTTLSRADQELNLAVIDKTPLGAVCANLGHVVKMPDSYYNSVPISSLGRYGGAKSASQPVKDNYSNKPKIYVWRNAEVSKLKKGDKITVVVSDSGQFRNYMGKPLKVYLMKK